MKYVLKIVTFCIALLVLSCNQKTEVPTTETSLDLPKGTVVDIRIDKSDYTLQLFVSDSLVKTYNVVFGGNPEGDKFKEGDRRTPEGKFGIRDKYPHKSWSKFIWIDYPNATSWERFNKRKAEGLISEGETIGGEIGIHGVPEGSDALIDNKTNWTLGCISMKNKDINEMYPYISELTTITITK